MEDLVGAEVVAYLQRFDLNHELHSSPHSLEYLADMFATASGLRVGTGISSGRYRLGSPFMKTSLPGPELVFPNHKSTRASEPSTDLTDLRASFIQSGPFKLKQTSDFRRHLELTHDNELFVFDTTALGTASSLSWWRPVALDAYNGHALSK